jgi:hypothetical protein
MWFAPKMLDPEHDGFYLEHILSAEYKRDWLGKRPPIFVCLPSASYKGGRWFCVDSRADGAGEGGWTVTGEPPCITVTPSINCVGEYHGFIRDGIIGDDVEGRRFE